MSARARAWRWSENTLAAIMVAVLIGTWAILIGGFCWWLVHVLL